MGKTLGEAARGVTRVLKIRWCAVIPSASVILYTHARAELVGYRMGWFQLDDPIVLCRELTEALTVLEQW